ncbi:retrovirus-related pol polyprotein from transposon TNT 1-94, partial [Tanacetum coccineum]
MSDHIPFEIQIEIIKKVSDVKSLVRFMSVSKPWKSFIDSSEFIKGYDARNTQPHSHILSYKIDNFLDDAKYICLVDDETFKVQQQEFAPFVVSPLLKQYWIYNVVGACHGLLCLYGFHKGYKEWVLLIWNPSIGKSFGIAASRTYNKTDNYWTDYGFGVCPVTKDPTLVKFRQTHNKPWHVEVSTLSSRVWNVIPSSNLPHQSIILDAKTQVVIDRFIYWGVYEETFVDDGEYTTNPMVVSFDLIT